MYVGLWDELGTDWVCLDAEVLPWSLKAQDLLRQQYAPAGRAGLDSLRQSLLALDNAIAHGTEAADLRSTLADRLAQVERYVEVYGGYVWPVSDIIDVRMAPFHLLASEGVVHVDKPHRWHLDTLARLAAGNDSGQPFLTATASIDVDLDDDESVHAGISWWEDLTASGGEGMVVKPTEFVARRGPRDRLVQPAIKCRGREYLRLTYGPEYADRRTLSVFAPEQSLESVRWPCANSPSESKDWSASSAGSRFTVSMSVLSVFWRWRVSRSIRGCKQCC